MIRNKAQSQDQGLLRFSKYKQSIQNRIEKSSENHVTASFLQELRFCYAVCFHALLSTAKLGYLHAEIFAAQIFSDLDLAYLWDLRNSRLRFKHAIFLNAFVTEPYLRFICSYRFKFFEINQCPTFFTAFKQT